MADALLWPAVRFSPRRLTRAVPLLLHASQRSFVAATARTVTVMAGAGQKVANVRRSGSAADERGGRDPVWTSRAGWACVKHCGACCVLDKGPDYPPIEEILSDPVEAASYRSMVGADGWCINYDKPSRSCKIHDDRPRFCRVEPEIFKALYGIEENDMDKEACGFCQDQIRSVYGGRSKELKTFQRVVRNLKKSS